MGKKGNKIKKPNNSYKTKSFDSSPNPLYIAQEIEFKAEDFPLELNVKELRSRNILLALVLLLFIFGVFLKIELTTSYFQAKYFYNLSKELTFKVVNGDHEVFQSPNGPFDERLGYSKANIFRESLKQNGFTQSTYSEVNPKAYTLSNYGINYPYHEKTKGGIKIFGDSEELLYNFTEPSWVFDSFNNISKIIVDTLLYIEDRSILQKDNPNKNPAVEWDRFLKAILDLVISKFTGVHDVPGGSTLATQIEKFKHSEGGRTIAPTDKLRQMYSASLRSYHSSKDTTEARKDIVLDYINSVPLAAVKGYGEIHGLGDGLWAYFGEDPKKANELLSKNISEADDKNLKEQASVYRKVLSLFLAHRRPSDYLDDNPRDLQLQVDTYLPLLFKEGIISYELFKYALGAEAPHRRVLPLIDAIHFSSRKGPNVVRNHLLNALSIKSLYELDRLDLEVNSTINVKVQENVSRLLLSLNSKDEIKKLGLDGFRLLSTSADPKKVIYSFTLFENKDGFNKVRVQTDTYDQPLNINEGVKLDLGSTSKYRTIITYLEIIEDIYNRYKDLSTPEIKKQIIQEKDPISQWGLNYLLQNQNINIKDFLEASLDRQYSASPAEGFFTAGGLHHFSNFNAEDNGKVLPIRLALRHSVNLPFIRLMRDMVKYFTYHTEGSAALTLANLDETKREKYLKQFADQEGKVFIRRFYDKYQKKNPEQIISVLLDTTKRIPKRFAAIFWFINPNATLEDFITFMKKNVDHAALNEKELSKYYNWYSNVALSLGDKGYLAKMHPLELWIAAYLINNPGAKLSEIIENSKEERIAVYDWLMKTNRKPAQDKRIQILLEAEAFQEIYQRWKRVGYPLPTLVPSYATALGTSADRPDALAELMGIISNGGKRYKKSIIESLNFAKDTPYEMSFNQKVYEAEQVLSTELVEVAKPLLFDIVSNGTAVRLKDGIKIAGNTYPVGGKTGTGDHRYQVFGKGGALLEKRVVNRTATFMFLIGDKYFGVLTAFVPGREAAQYKFTSALPVQILKIIAPALSDLEKSDS